MHLWAYRAFHLLLLVQMVRGVGLEAHRPVEQYCSWNSHEINCDNLTRLDDIFLDNETLPMDTRLFDKFIIHPLSPILFDMNVLLYYNIEFRDEYELSLVNFNGFEMNTSDKFNNHFNRTQVHLTISNSSFNLYLNKKPLVDGSECSQGANFFSRFRSLELMGSMTYPNKICREVFANVKLQSFIISSLSPANSISFHQADTMSHNLNSNIERLVIQNSRFYLESQLLDELVFSMTKEISIESSELLMIEDSLFENYRFPSLRTLRLSLMNFHEFFSLSNTDWLLNLNSNAFIRPKLLTVYLQDERSEYEYPDEDICLFKNWPHENLVFPVLGGSSNQTECTCTILWLIKNWPLLTNDLTKEMYITSITSPCFRPDTDFNSLVDRCAFEQKLSNCSIMVNTNPNSISFTTQTTDSTSMAESTTRTTSTLQEEDKDSQTLIIKLTVGIVILSVAFSLTVFGFVVYFFRVKIKERIAKMRIRKDEISFATFVSSLNAKDYYFVNRS